MATECPAKLASAALASAITSAAAAKPTVSTIKSAGPSPECSSGVAAARVETLGGQRRDLPVDRRRLGGHRCGYESVGAGTVQGEGIDSGRDRRRHIRCDGSRSGGHICCCTARDGVR